jgi:Na+-driven multidrug efflux pump
MFANLVFGLWLVLGYFVKDWEGYGFQACPMVTSSVQWVMVFYIVTWFVLIRKLHAKCWPGWSWGHITKGRVHEYLKQYIPLALSIASDFWRVAAIGAICTDIGKIQLGVFNVSYRILWICLTFIGSLSSACGIKISQALGAGDSALAEKFVRLCLSMIALILVILSCFIALNARSLGKIFSDDEEILDMFESIRFPLAIWMLAMNLSVGNEIILSNMGRSKLVLYLGLVGSWIGQVPGVFFAVYYYQRDITSLYYGSAFGYVLLCTL